MKKQISRALCLSLPVCLFALLAIAAHSALAQNTSPAHSSGGQNSFSQQIATKSNSSALEKQEALALNKPKEDSSVQFLMGDMWIEKGSLDEYLSASKSNR